MLDLLREVVTRVASPLVVLMALGFLLQRRVDLDRASLMKVLMNLVLPCALVHLVASANAPLSTVLFTAVFVTLQFVAFLLLGRVIARIARIDPALSWVFALCFAYPNAANYGIPVIEIAFGPDWILHQGVVTAVQAVLIVVSASLLLSEDRLRFASLFTLRPRSPLIPAVIIGLVVKAVGIPIPVALAEPMRLMAGALTPLALVILGAHIAASKWTVPWGPTLGLVGLRLLVAPILTAVALSLFATDPTLKDVLVVGSATPVGVLLAILVADERHRTPAVDRATQTEFVSASIAVTTLLSPIAVVVVLTVLNVTLHVR